MRTSLTEIEQIEKLLLAKGGVQDRLAFEAMVLANPELQKKVQWQSRCYNLIQHYGREKLIEEIKSVEYQLFQTPKYRSFQDRIKSIFKK